MGKCKKYLPTIAIAIILLLSAASCSSQPVSINRVVIASQINTDNSPIAESQINVLSTTPAIYLAAEVLNAREGTAVDVEWRYLTGDRLVATESFRGGRSEDTPHEFITGVAPVDSWLSSRITLNSLSWAIGSYEVVVKLNNQEAKRINFNVVGSREFDELAKQALVEAVYLGSKLNDQNQVTIPGTRFRRAESTIYAVVLLKNAPASTGVQAVWEQLETGRQISTFSTTFSGSGYLPFDISLSAIGKNWPDRLWPAGNYSVSIYVDKVLVTTKNFSVS
ncbi:hypothetical protein A2810_01165 [candidate division Kazan bacterium RIFCSPHIGHO2_01_FULL_49_10]|uniref:Uncharacterized protein n=1 Tax=candidate division Kazan bacterium RIFCSPLOWO2_01_FULL_48_13 TaxID=1798539 RepID=A0A1F4PPX8_UNCK3|nr:MAG: hypothetical protein A2810_01165 [candidate division Kazan bacterium RIFCSPHIGHO2_01_FULL_49_10]OGB85665.1 MAG: hypothetical protein A2994_02775 [candidate division Kazan bacterium RIFCSPLOWO2_01_FULL_48_13]